jgi:hypothetical protein
VQQALGGSKMHPQPGGDSIFRRDIAKISTDGPDSGGVAHPLALGNEQGM